MTTDVVVTGLGATTPLGGDVTSTWDAMLAGRSGVTPLTQEWAAQLPVRIAAQLAVEPSEMIDRVKLRRLDRSEAVALIAAHQAWKDAGLAPATADASAPVAAGIDPERLAVVASARGLPAGAYTHSWTYMGDASRNPIGVEWFGLAMGLGFVLSFGYWCTDFLVVQRAMAADSMTAARRTPLIAAVPKMLFPFLVILPGMIALVLAGPHAGAVAGQGLIPAKLAATASVMLAVANCAAHHPPTSIPNTMPRLPPVYIAIA